MLFKFPKDDMDFHWTEHSKGKMLYYRISEQKVKTVLKNPDRKEEGIAPKTVAAMKRHDTTKRKEEVWVMYQTMGSGKWKVRGDRKRTVKVISTWRYPGVSQKRKVPIPDDVLALLTEN